MPTEKGRGEGGGREGESSSTHIFSFLGYFSSYFKINSQELQCMHSKIEVNKTIFSMIDSQVKQWSSSSQMLTTSQIKASDFKFAIKTDFNLNFIEIYNQ